MSKATVAQSTATDKGIQGSSRSKRGLDLYWLHGDDIHKTGEHTYLVPGCSAAFYEVNLSREDCNCPDFSNRNHGEGFYCKHLFAAMLYSIKHPDAEVVEREEKPISWQAPSACAGCGVLSGKPSEGGSALSGKGPGSPLYCMDCNLAFGGGGDIAGTLDRMAQKMEVT